MSGDLSYEILGEGLELMPERALYWLRREMLMVADAHWGRASGFWKFGKRESGENMEKDLARLSLALDRKTAKRLLILGDLFHSSAKHNPRLLSEIEQWRNCHPDLEITVVRGEHDQGANTLLEDWDFMFVDGPILIPPFFVKHNAILGEMAYTISGHLHPTVELVGESSQRIRRHCFWFGKRIGILPAFGSNAIGRLFKPDPGDDVFIVEEDQVCRLD